MMWIMILILVVGCVSAYVYTSEKEKQRLNETITYQSSLIRDLTEDMVYLDGKQRGGLPHVSS
ncbi:hypothetical protein HCJ39_06980 [Listeria rocourtiae]|uniref:hypothetical protein n=1 Tax=Listeria rocourtiae TaxID=647910 RepID=UPI001627533C|nr:hypothetical protein [Listeria rocourtiae]MBC1604453.1 hypothetical protein [Listeria rocourtiae]